MAHEDSLTHAIDWDVDRATFEANINSLISLATDNKKILPLPIAIVKGEPFLEMVIAITMQVDCNGCNAHCCRTNPDGSNISMAWSDYDQLRLKHTEEELHNKGIYIRGATCVFPSPCPFLMVNTCRIYDDRPFICIMYPISNPARDGTGAPMLAVESSCPEARRIARKLYMDMWLLRKRVGARGK